MDGNHFTDTGRDDDAIGNFVTALAGEGHLFPPGTVCSWSNSGHAALGRLVEALRGKLFHDVFDERLVTPLAT
ncbi:MULTISPECIES: serine hydrolase [Amycolatopsis]|uniref:serine hydrolase n=1 Tax=Amycolatopsis TaxID=1813 RepID=UPI0018E2F2E1